MMIFQARLTGSFVPQSPWDGLVGAMYSKAVNILHPDGFFISFLPDSMGMSVFGLVAPEVFNRPSNLIHEGAKVRWTGKSFIFDDFRIDTGGTVLWEGVITREIASGITPEVIKDFLAEYIDHAPAEGLAPVVTGGSRNIHSRFALRFLSKATEGKGDKVPPDLSGFVGLGPGFTPSGDDFLTGVLLGEQIQGRWGESLWGDSIRQALPGTSCGGKTLLLGALEGRFPAYLLRSMEQLASGDISGSLETIGSHGATSGWDAAAGFLWFFEWMDIFC
ncbi:MAG: DUF2877 domain-containing protein [Spirochaetales bacterium]|nr:DUF2877 domain-containing protein [Spirochaetales bacterium]